MSTKSANLYWSIIERINNISPKYKKSVIICVLVTMIFLILLDTFIIVRLNMIGQITPETRIPDWSARFGVTNSFFILPVNVATISGLLFVLLRVVISKMWNAAFKLRIPMHYSEVLPILPELTITILTFMLLVLHFFNWMLPNLQSVM